MFDVLLSVFDVLMLCNVFDVFFMCFDVILMTCDVFGLLLKCFWNVVGVLLICFIVF